MRNYLDFEKEIKNLEQDLDSSKNPFDKEGISEVNTNKIEKIQDQINEKLGSIYSNLNSWQKTQVARHEDRPRANFYVKKIISDFTQLSGDRLFGEDKSIIAGLGFIENKSVLVLAQEKGEDLNSRLDRNFGMMKPEGYRKCIRLMMLADRFKIPVISFIDTPGAYPGIESEERGMSEAIAKNLSIMSGLKVPIIVIITGEGGSGGALAIGVGDHISMLQYSIYSVASPEACASIVWRDNSKAQEAAEAMKLDAENLLDFGLIDNIIDEPLGGAHRDTKKASSLIAQEIDDNLKRLKEINIDELVEKRYQKIMSYGSIQK